jgi:hypothetical protein
MMNTIDADGHIVEKDADVRKHLPEPHSKRGPLLPSDGMDTGMGGLVGGMEHVDIPTRLKDMDREGIDVSVLFPTSSFAVNSFIDATTRLPMRALTTTLSPRYAANRHGSRNRLAALQDPRRRFRKPTAQSLNSASRLSRSPLRE